MHHPMKPPVRRKRRIEVQVSPSAPSWPNYQGASQYVGTSAGGRVTVYVDPILGQPGLQNAQDLVNDADRVVTANDLLFGTQGGAVSVIVYSLNGQTDGTGGADHGGCDYVTGAAIEVCASFGNSARVSALFEAELSECSMGGNLCGMSTGEALSRWCAAVIGNNALSDFATAPTWQQDGMPDFVDQTDGTDGNADSTGCGMAFLSWLMSQGYTLSQIAQAMVGRGSNGTLAQLYSDIGAGAAGDAWNNFSIALQNLPGPITSDDPFDALAGGAQLLNAMTLRVASHGDVPLAEVRQFLQAFEHAYNCLAIFEASTGASSGPSAWWLPAADFRIEESQAMILPGDRLRLSSVSLSSPGFWEFLGTLNPLEVIRKYLQDRHERMKDISYRNEQEKKLKNIEIAERQLEFVAKRIELAQKVGLPPQAVASLVTQLVERPLNALGALQDAGFIAIQLEVPATGNGAPTHHGRTSLPKARTA